MQKTKKFRIAAAIDINGTVSASYIDGDEKASMDIAVDCVDEGERRYWITAELPIPDVKEVAGKVEFAE